MIYMHLSVYVKSPYNLVVRFTQYSLPFALRVRW